MLDVKVKIDLAKPTGKVGFGIPLILEEKATTDIAYIECSNMSEVVSAGFDTNSKVYKSANTIFMQNEAPAKIAVCATTNDTKTWLNNIDNVNKNWRQLIVVTEGETTIAVENIMTTIETTSNKMYFADLDVEDTTITAEKTSGIQRTVLFYCKATTDVPSPVSALVGATAGLTTGSFTYKNIVLKGIAPQALTDTQIEAIHAKGGITFVTKAGDNVTSEGKVAGGEYIDIIDSLDYVVYNLEYQTQKKLNNEKKIPYDDRGITSLENVARVVLKDCYAMGIIATNDDGSPAYSTNYAMRKDTDENDRAVRKYVGGQCSFALAGAIHLVDPIIVEVTY